MIGLPVRQQTALWLTGIGEKLRIRLARAGLIDAKPAVTLEAFIASWLEAKRLGGGKPAALATLQAGLQGLRQLLGARPLGSIGHTDAEAYLASMRTRGLKPATIHKRIQRARQVFTDAVRRGLVAQNPFEHLRVRAGNPAARRVYIPVPDAIRVIEHCPNVWWRLLVALARFGGLRIPSEAFSLRWADVNWKDRRLVVPSPKTEGQGKPHRVIPLFLLLRPYLEEAFDAAEDGAEYVIPQEYRRRAQGPAGWRNANLRSTLAKVIRRAGLVCWPRLWQNLRASCESDMAQVFPLPWVTKWMGNTPTVALRHYVDVTDVAYQQALSWIHGKPLDPSTPIDVAYQQALSWIHGKPLDPSTPIDIAGRVVQNPTQ